MKISLFFASAIMVAVAFVNGIAFGQYEGSNGNLANNLFQQYYTQGGASQTTAGMYPAPHWVPGNVGNTYYTYQPLMPHEMMWQHSRNYYNYQAGPEAFYQSPCSGCAVPQGGSSLNVTKVRWQSGANHMGPLPFSTAPFAKAQYAWASHLYCLGGNCGGLGGCRHGARQSGQCGSGNCGGATCNCQTGQ